jgi:hypothetical protein
MRVELLNGVLLHLESEIDAAEEVDRLLNVRVVLWIICVRTLEKFRRDKTSR